MISSSLIFMLALCAGFPAQAQTSTDSAAGFQTLLAEKLKESKLVWIGSPYFKPAIAPLLPVWTFHDAFPPYTDLLEIGMGGKFRDGEKPQPFLGFCINLVGISGRLWNFPWALAHVRRSVFPVIFLGPGISAPIELASARDLT